MKISNILFFILSLSLIITPSLSGANNSEAEETCTPGGKECPDGDCEDEADSGSSGGDEECSESFTYALKIGLTSIPHSRNFLSSAREGALEGALDRIFPRSFDEIRSQIESNKPQRRLQTKLRIKSPTIGAHLADPSIIRYNEDTSTEFIKDNSGVLRQALTDNCLTDIKKFTDGSGYQVRVWCRNGVSFTKPAGEKYYTLPDSSESSLVTEASFRNPDHPADNHRLLLSINRTVGTSNLFTSRLYTQTNDPQTDLPTRQLVESYNGGPDLSGELLSIQELLFSNHGEKTWDYDVERRIWLAHTAADGTLTPPTLGVDEFLVSHTYEKYADFTPNDGEGAIYGKRLLERTIAYGTQEAATTTHTFIDEPNNPLLHGRIQSRIEPDGAWEFHEYSDSGGSSMAQTTYSSWKNVPIQEKERAKKVTTVISRFDVTRTTSINNVQIAAERLAYSFSPGFYILTQETFDGTEWQPTLTGRYRSTVSSARADRKAWVEHPDGTATTYDYALNGRELTITMREGAGDRNGITAGTQTVSVLNGSYQLIEETMTDIESNLVINNKIADASAGFDNVGRPLKWIYNYNPDDYLLKQYGCCGIEILRNREGTTTTIYRDPLKRVYRENVVAGSRLLSTTTAYTGLTERHELTSGGLTVLLGQSTRSLGGLTTTYLRPDSDGDGQPEVSTEVMTYRPSGGTFTKETDPEGGTYLRYTFPDGQLNRLSGTAVVNQYFSYGTHNLNGGGLYHRVYEDHRSQHETTFSDQADRPFRIQFADGARISHTYHPLSAPAGSRTQLANTTDLDVVTTSHSYNDEGKRLTSIRPLPNNLQMVTTTEHDVIEDADIGITLRTRTTVNDVLTQTSLRSVDGFTSRAINLAGTTTITQTIPDISGSYLITTVHPKGSRQVQTFVEGLQTRTEFFNNVNKRLETTIQTHDPLERLLTSTDGRNNTTTYNAYLENGSLVSMTDAAGHTTAYTYDQLGRRLTVDASDTFDASGKTLSNITHTSYEPTDQVRAIWGGQTYPRFHRYDEQNRLVELRTYKNLAYGTEPTETTPGGSPTTWIYSPERGFPVAKRYADGQGTDYSYYPSGRPHIRTWARGVVTTYTYDHGLLSSMTYSNEASGYTTPNLTYMYDSFGRLNQVHRANQLHADYEYDPVTLELITERLNQDSLPKTLNRTYNYLLELKGYSVAGEPGIAALFTYDGANRLKTVSQPGLNNSTHTYRYLNGTPTLLASVTSPIHRVNNTYEPDRKLLLRKSNTLFNGTLISRHIYTNNGLGQRTSHEQLGTAFDQTQTIAHGYDTLGQVVSTDHPNNTFDQGFQYDQIGNRKESVSGTTILSGTPNYSANALNQYTAIPVGSNPIYDNDGNALAYPLPADLSSNSTLQWDAENRLISASLPNGTTITYDYDHLGRRTSSQTNSGPITHYLYDDWNPIAEFTGSSLSKRYLWGMDLSGSLQGVGGVGGLLTITEEPSGNTYTPTYDSNGNIYEYLDSSGAIVAHYEYDAFGNTIAQFGSKAQDFAHRFSTKPIEDTGLYYYGYRYYDPKTGRWPSKDPIGEVGHETIVLNFDWEEFQYQENLKRERVFLANQIVNWQSKLASKSFPVSDVQSFQEALENISQIDYYLKRYGIFGSDYRPETLPEGPSLYAFIGNQPVNLYDNKGNNAGSLAAGWGGAIAEPTPFGEAVMICVTICVAGKYVTECYSRPHRSKKRKSTKQKHEDADAKRNKKGTGGKGTRKGNRGKNSPANRERQGNIPNNDPFLGPPSS